MKQLYSRHTLLTASMMIAVIAMTAASAQARQRTLQLAEDSAVSKRISTGRTLAPTRTQVCEKGAKWIRLGFQDLTLGSYDSLTLESSGGDRFVFEGNHWNNRSFHTRALRGDCVTLTPSFGSPDSKYTLDSYQAGSLALTESTVTVAGAGDICDSTPADCGNTADLIVSINPTAVFTAGDNAYSNGTLTEYNNYYDPNWGQFKALTSPTPGNHEYGTAGAKGYFDYFNGEGVQVGAAGDRSKGYYSWDVGDWHFIALNTQTGGTVATAQLDWLDADLAANTKPCTAAYFHHPLVSRGNYTGYSSVKPFWDRLYAKKADLVLVGHDHNYQRYAKMDGSQAAKTDGIRQVLVGTGGRDFYSLSGTHSLLEKSIGNTHGVLKLTLTSTGYTGAFVPVSGSNTDSFSADCNSKTPPSNLPPVANFGFVTSGLTATFTDSSTDSDGSIASRAWTFGDGASSTATNPAHTYASAGTNNVTLTVTDNGGATHSVTKTVTVTAPTGNVLSNGVAVSVSGRRNQEFTYTANLAAGASNLAVTLSGGTGNADLYVKFGSAPSTTSYDCRSANAGNTESCSFAASSAGTWYIKVRGAKNFNAASLKASWTP